MHRVCLYRRQRPPRITSIFWTLLTEIADNYPCWNLTYGDTHSYISTFSGFTLHAMYVDRMFGFSKANTVRTMSTSHPATRRQHVDAVRLLHSAIDDLRRRYCTRISDQMVSPVAKPEEHPGMSKLAARQRNEIEISDTHLKSISSRRVQKGLSTVSMRRPPYRTPSRKIRTTPSTNFFSSSGVARRSGRSSILRCWSP